MSAKLANIGAVNFPNEQLKQVSVALRYSIFIIIIIRHSRYMYVNVAAVVCIFSRKAAY
jgi:hypothetical protein